MRTILALPLLLSLAVLPIQAEEGAPAAGVQYVELKPAFVGTVGPGPKIQYMKIDVALRANDGTAVPRIEYHDPLIRNALVSLFAHEDPGEYRDAGRQGGAAQQGPHEGPRGT